MPGDWIECTLADACSRVDYGFTASASTDAVGPKFLRITDIVSGHIDWADVPHVAANEKTSDKYRLSDGDIVLARTGASTGASAFIKDPPKAVFASYLVRLRANPQFEPRYLSYYLKSRQFREFMQGVLGDKSAQPNASASTMTKAPLHAPRTRREQQAIADILGNLDDKIELNRRMTETLEAIADQLFHDWFVEYGPIRAKLGGGAPYYPDWLWSLFPGSLSFEGRPTGWVPMRVGEIGTVITGKTPSTKKQENFGHHVPFVTIPDMRGKVFVHETSRSLSKTGAASQASKTLPPGSICVSCIATPGLVAMTTQPSQTNQQINSVIPFNSDETYFWFMALRGMGNTILQHGSGGSVLPNLSRGRFIELTTAAASPELRRAFHLLTEPIFAAIRVRGSEVSTLVDLRDTLLPKLISGELRVPQAEQLVSEAV